MIIRNFKQLATDQDKKWALSIIERGLVASLPYVALEKIVKENHLQIGRKKLSLKYARVYVVAIGKSSDLMTRVVNLNTRIHGGIVVMPDKVRSLINAKKFTIIRAGHPIPTKKSIIAARKISVFLKSLGPSDFVIFLISGGTSSLVSLPDGISLKNKQLVTNQLLKCGADISEINCIRKHISQIKGGRLLKSLKCKAISLVMSDVIGNDLSVIASGTTYCDRSTFFDAKKILLKYHLENLVPKPVWHRIILGTKGAIPETPKKARIENYVISANKDCVEIMAEYAQKLGLETKTLWPIDGNVNDAASKISKYFPNRAHSCLVFGGETTVIVKGKGKGGRNQELVLNLLKKLQDSTEKVVAVSVGTDGIDGNTSVAGAIADSTMPLESIKKYLRKNNSYCYFRKHGGAVFTGPTHTNLMDIGLVLRK